MSDRTAPTHILRIELPLNLNATIVLTDADVIQECLAVVMAATRIGVDRVLCGDVSVMLSDVREAP